MALASGGGSSFPLRNLQSSSTVAVPLPDPDRLPSAGQVFNNPDGFAMAFSDAWESFERQQPGHGLDCEAKFALVMQSLAEHPFLQEEPQQAEQLARFRIRLLNY